MAGPPHFRVCSAFVGANTANLQDIQLQVNFGSGYFYWRQCRVLLGQLNVENQRLRGACSYLEPYVCVQYQ